MTLLHSLEASFPAFPPMVSTWKWAVWAFPPLLQERIEGRCLRSKDEISSLRSANRSPCCSVSATEERVLFQLLLKVRGSVPASYHLEDPRPQRHNKRYSHREQPSLCRVPGVGRRRRRDSVSSSANRSNTRFQSLVSTVSPSRPIRSSSFGPSAPWALPEARPGPPWLRYWRERTPSPEQLLRDALSELRKS